MSFGDTLPLLVWMNSSHGKNEYLCFFFKFGFTRLITVCSSSASRNKYPYKCLLPLSYYPILKVESWLLLMIILASEKFHKTFY